MSSNLLGEFLRARREASALCGEQMPSLRRRRTPGLRREEVATRAGISVDYYTRLEQGRDRHPSAQILTALARALELDGAETRHLHALATPSPMTADAGDNPPSEHLVLTMESWTFGPAYIINQRCDVVRRNHLTDVVFAPFSHTDNVLRLLFLDPQAKASWTNWNEFAAAIVGGLRAMLGPRFDEPENRGFIDELCTRSSDFDEHWHRYSVSIPSVKTKTLRHPELGLLEFDYELLTALSDPVHMLILHSTRSDDARTAALPAR